MSHLSMLFLGLQQSSQMHQKPYYLLKPLNQKEPVIDPRITFLVKDILTEAA